MESDSAVMLEEDFGQNGKEKSSPVAGYEDVFSPPASENWQTSNSGVSLVHTKVQQSKNNLLEGDGREALNAELQSRYVETKSVDVVLHDDNEEIDLEALFNYSGEEYDLINITNNCSSE